MAFNPVETIISFLEPVDLYALSNDEGYKDYQIGRHISVYDGTFPSLEGIDVVLVGCGETRGMGRQYTRANSPDAVRAEFYALHYWHNEVTFADIGNIKTGETLQDTYAAVRMVVSEILAQNKRVVIIGGSHDLMLAQYQAHADLRMGVEVANIDAVINIDAENVLPSENFLMPLLTSEPNFVKQYNHIGYQSYFVHPAILETIDKLGFNCYRVGKVKEGIEEIEPVMRNVDMAALDIAALQHCYAPANRLSPNGFTGEEACTLMQFAGMSQAKTMGIYGYYLGHDEHNLTAKQMSQMLWYYADGLHRAKHEAELQDESGFIEYKIAFGEVGSIFLRSKRTSRWWMQLPGGGFIPCSYNDYLTASQNEIPERFIRAVERS